MHFWEYIQNGIMQVILYSDILRRIFDIDILIWKSKKEKWEEIVVILFLQRKM